MSVNEESQSTNEELEASREEMQSLNEELNTINAELGGKLEELDRANSDLNNLFEATQIATVFLDRNLVIRNFTPAASTFFNLRPADVGRPLTDLASQLDYPGLRMDIAEVFRTGNTIEHRLAPDVECRAAFHLKDAPERGGLTVGPGLEPNGGLIAFLLRPARCSANSGPKSLRSETGKRLNLSDFSEEKVSLPIDQVTSRLPDAGRASRDRDTTGADGLKGPCLIRRNWLVRVKAGFDHVRGGTIPRRRS